MASIKKRGTRWFARYRDSTGREHAQRFDRKTDAQHWLDEQTAALVTGQYVDPRAGRITLRTYGEKWQETAPHGPTTRDLVARSLERHIYPVLGDLPMSAIRLTQVQALVTSMGTTLAPSTARVKYSYLVSIMNAAVLDKVITSSPCGGVRLPEVRIPFPQPLPESIPRVLFDDEVAPDESNGQMCGMHTAHRHIQCS